MLMPALASPTTWMATILAPVDAREVVRCDRCYLTQFRTITNLCRRCKTSLDAEEPEPAPAPAAPAPEPQDGNGYGLHVAAAIRALRQRGGLSQRQLALRMGVPRTYVSKIENEKATPTLSSMQRLATALQVTIPDLLRGDAHTHEEQVRELMADQFIGELIPYIGKLNGMQWTSVLSQVRDLTLHPRRTA
jgi:transcriptional regulator with XRE-family HTH domain